jgi:hypothetical protein
MLNGLRADHLLELTPKQQRLVYDYNPVNFLDL